MKKLKKVLVVISLLIGIVFTVAPASVSAYDPFDTACSGQNTELCNQRKTDSLPAIIKNAVNVMLYVLGAVSVVYIVVGGLQYTTSMGDANNIKRAKDTILYSVIGLIVAIMAYAIVNFVVTQFTK